LVADCLCAQLGIDYWLDLVHVVWIVVV